MPTLIGVALLLLAAPAAGDGPGGLPPAPVSDAVLRRLLPELDGPRGLTETDLDAVEGRAFRDHDLALWVAGDLHCDRGAAVAVAGRTRGGEAFVAVLTRRAAGWVRRFLLRVPSRVVGLLAMPHPDPDAARAGCLAILASFTAVPGDDYAWIYLDRGTYRSVMPGRPE